MVSGDYEVTTITKISYYVIHRLVLYCWTHYPSRIIYCKKIGKNLYVHPRFLCI